MRRRRELPEGPPSPKRRRLAAAIAAASVAPLVSSCATLTCYPRPREERGNPPLLIAHHGAARIYPENTIEACNWAVSHQHANALEVDLCFSHDNQVFLWHDWSPDDPVSLVRQAGLQPDNLFRPVVPGRGSAMRRPVSELTLAQIRENYSYERLNQHFDTEWAPAPTMPPQIPSLREFLAWARLQPGLKTIFLDFKMPNSEALRAPAMLDAIHSDLQTISREDLKVVLMVWESEVLTALQVHNADRNYKMVFTWDVNLPAGVILDPPRFSAIDRAVKRRLSAASVGRPTEFTLFPWTVYRSIIDYDLARWRIVNSDPSQYNGGRSIDMLVAWTINKYDELAWLAAAGVSGIITDDIPSLQKAIAATSPPP